MEEYIRTLEFQATKFAEGLSKLLGTCVEARETSNKVFSGHPPPSVSAVESVDEPLLDVIKRYETIVEDLVAGLRALQEYVTTCIPEMKDEDNRGVHVQLAFLENITRTIDELLGHTSCRRGNVKPAKVRHPPHVPLDLGARYMYFHVRSDILQTLQERTRKSDSEKQDRILPDDDLTVSAVRALREELHAYGCLFRKHIISSFDMLITRILGIFGFLRMNYDKILNPRPENAQERSYY